MVQVQPMVVAHDHRGAFHRFYHVQCQSQALAHFTGCLQWRELFAGFHLVNGLLADESVANGVGGTDVEAAGATEAIGGEYLAGNTVLCCIEWTCHCTCAAFGAAVMVYPHAEDAHSLEKPAYQAEGAYELIIAPDAMLNTLQNPSFRCSSIGYLLLTVGRLSLSQATLLCPEGRDGIEVGGAMGWVRAEQYS